MRIPANPLQHAEYGVYRTVSMGGGQLARAPLKLSLDSSADKIQKMKKDSSAERYFGTP